MLGLGEGAEDAELREPRDERLGVVPRVSSSWITGTTSFSTACRTARTTCRRSSGVVPAR